jgi:hypothetical protein
MVDMEFKTKEMQVTTLELIDRERAAWGVTKSGPAQTQWIVGRSPYFISHKEDGDELWQSNQPYGVNDRIYKFPAGYAPTLEDVDEVLDAC